MKLPNKLGDYEVLERIGAGGMGEVYRAHDPRLGRDIAIKLLPAAVEDDRERLRRLDEEARALAALSHPNIVTIYSVEEAAGVRFLTMELVEGHTLDELNPPAGMALETLFSIAVSLADAVAAAHGRGILHRDLKPANVMVTGEGRVKVLDFGLAKRTPEPAEGDIAVLPTETLERLTREGQALGTVPYMAPEQLRGQSATPRSDVFSLGAVLYQMASGRRPFSGNSAPEVASAILRDAPEPLRDLRPELPVELEHLVARCIEKDPTRRLQTALDLRNELEHLQELSSRGREPGRRDPRPGHPPDLPSSIAVLPFVSMNRDEDSEFLADGISEEIINALGRLPDLKVLARTSAFSFKGRTGDLRVIGEKLGVSTILEGSLRRVGERLRITAQLVDVESGYHLWSERYDRRMIDVFEIQDEIARSIASRLSTTLGEGSTFVLVDGGPRDLAAFQLYAEGRTLLQQETTREAMRRAVRCFQAAIERDVGYALAWSGLADALVSLEDYGYAEPGSLLPRVEAAVDRALELNPDLAEVQGSRALLHYRRRQGPATLRVIDEAIAIRPSYANAYILRSFVNLQLGNPSRALESAKRAADLNPLSTEAVANLALGYLARGEPERALRETRRVREIEPEYDSVIPIEGAVLYSLERFDVAREILEGASVPWAGSAPVAILALVDAAEGHRDEARRRLRELEESGEPELAALVHAALGEVDQAFAALERVESWAYWPTLALRYFFPSVLDSIRRQSRFRQVLAVIDRHWGVDPGSTID